MSQRCKRCGNVVTGDPGACEPVPEGDATWFEKRHWDGGPALCRPALPGRAGLVVTKIDRSGGFLSFGEQPGVAPGNGVRTQAPPCRKASGSTPGAPTTRAEPRPGWNLDRAIDAGLRRGLTPAQVAAEVYARGRR